MSTKKDRKNNLNSFLQEMGFGDLVLPPVSKNPDDSSSDSSGSDNTSEINDSASDIGSGISDTSGEPWSVKSDITADTVNTYDTEQTLNTANTDNTLFDESENNKTTNKSMSNSETSTKMSWLNKLRDKGDSASMDILKRRGSEWVVRTIVCILMFQFIQDPKYGSMSWYILMSGCITGIIFILYNWYSQIISDKSFQVDMSVAIDAMWLLLFGNILRLFLRNFSAPKDMEKLKCDVFYRYLHIILGIIIFVHILIFIVTILTFVPATRNGAANTLKMFDSVI